MKIIKMNLKKISVSTLILVFIFAASIAASASTVSRSFSTLTPQQCAPLDVTLTVTVTAGDTYYAIDEVYPAGWTVSNPGTGDTTQAGHLKWVVISGAANTIYTYTINVPCAATGNAIFDGTYGFSPIIYTIGGQNTVTIASACTDMDMDGVNVGGGACGPVDCNDMNASVWRLARLYTDADGDTYVAGGLSIQSYCIGLNAPPGFVESATQPPQDCNDNNASINPAAIEICNGVDDNCNGQIDEGVKTTFYQDFDLDTFGNAAASQQACTQPAGYVLDNTDCNDNNASIKPTAVEICNLVDDNCNGQIDEGAPTTPYYQDADADTYGNSAVVQNACMQPQGYVLTGTDCNDANASIYQLLTGYPDLDADTYTLATPVQVCTGAALPLTHLLTPSALADCNDNNAAVNPAAIEICDGADNNCNGQIDEGLTSTFYRDFDLDTYGNPLSTIQACSVPAGYSLLGTDCNDNNAAIFPGATETCNNIDDNCNAQIDELLTRQTTCGVGICSGNLGTETCASGVWGTNTCNPFAGAVIESWAQANCNDALDNNCNGFTDATDPSCGACADGTTQLCPLQQGVCAGSTETCALNAWPGCSAATYSGWNAAYEGVETLCDGLDNDCDGLVDEGLTTTYYQDADSDTYGNPAVSQAACTQPLGYVLDNTDCDDVLASTHPLAPETCNLVDDNCNGIVDDGIASFTYYQDADADSYGNIAAPRAACMQPAGYVLDSTDCNDNSAAINPAALEICDNLDNNCNAQIDEGLLTTPFYRDVDADGFGNLSITLSACQAPAGYVATSTDCNDNSNTVFPGAAETCNGVDDDCDAIIDDNLIAPPSANTLGLCSNNTKICGGSLGWTENPHNYVPLPEACNFLDDNCDGLVDEGFNKIFFNDSDGDSYGNALVFQNNTCTQPTGFVPNNTDCDDTNPSVYQILTGYADKDNDGISDGIAAQVCSGASLPLGYLTPQSVPGDSIIGYQNNITTNQPCNVTFRLSNATGNYTNLNNYGGIAHVTLEGCSGEIIAEFDHDFSTHACDLTQTKAYENMGSTKSALISGVNLTSQNRTKTVYIYNVTAGINSVCVKDAEIANITEISSTCKGANEYAVPCSVSGTTDSTGKYNCTIINNGTAFKITGLSHSGVNQQGYCGDGTIQAGEQCDGANLNGQTCQSYGFNSGSLSCSPTTCTIVNSACFNSGGGAGGGGGGGGGGAACVANYTCGSWGACQPNSTQARTCTDSKKCLSDKTETQSCIYTAPAQSGTAETETETETSPTEQGQGAAVEQLSNETTTSGTSLTGRVIGGIRNFRPSWWMTLIALVVIAAVIFAGYIWYRVSEKVKYHRR